jgi:hypothetical protein
MLTWDGDPISTVRKLAKRIVCREMEGAYYWNEHYSDIHEGMSEQEREATSNEVERIIEGIIKQHRLRS